MISFSFLNYASNMVFITGRLENMINVCNEKDMLVAANYISLF